MKRRESKASNGRTTSFEILLTYNSKMVHSAHKFTPKDARKPSNELKVKFNLTMNAKRNRLYPDVDTADKVKIYRKKGVGEKERTSKWSANTYTVEKIEKKLNQNYYYVNGQTRPYLRHEFFEDLIILRTKFLKKNI